MRPFIELLGNVIDLINLALLVYVILSLLISFEVVNRRQPIVAKVYDFLAKLLEPALKRIRNFLPDLGGIDISPVILFLLLGFLKSLLFNYFYY